MLRRAHLWLIAEISCARMWLELSARCHHQSSSNISHSNFLYTAVKGISEIRCRRPRVLRVGNSAKHTAQPFNIQHTPLRRTFHCYCAMALWQKCTFRCHFWRLVAQRKTASHLLNRKKVLIWTEVRWDVDEDILNTI